MDVALFLIFLAGNMGLSNLKLQKMLYFVQLEHLRNRMIAFDNRMEAWQYGPVVPEVYFRFSGYGSRPIKFENLNLNIDEIRGRLTPESIDLIEQVFAERENQNVWNMVDETHGTAWRRAFDNKSGNQITVEMILDEIVEENRNG